MTNELKISTKLALPVDLVTESNGILGKKGSGKTSAGVVLFEEMYGAGVPVVAVDPKGDWYGIRSSLTGKSEGLPVPVFGGLRGDIPLEATGGQALAELIREQHMSCILDVSEFSAAERRRFLTPFANFLYRANDRTPMHLFLEESHEYIPQRVDAGDAPMVGMFERLVKNGRFKGIGVTMMSQRSASLNKNVMTQVDNLFVMRTVSPQDRGAVADWIKYEGQSTEILTTMSKLESGECWLYQPSRGVPVRFRFRMRQTFDAGATPKMGEVRTQPTNLADVDLTAIAAAMAETIEKAKADDPKELRQQIARLTNELRAVTANRDELANRPEPEPVAEPVEVPVLSKETEEHLASLMADLTQALNETHKTLVEASGRGAVVTHMAPPVRGGRGSVKVAIGPASNAPKPPPQAPVPVDGDVAFRSGARRMIESLGRMHPLRLTKGQWGTVSHMKTSGGTWSAYFREIKNAGFLDENSVGFTLTPAGFDYLGGQPDPMTAEELQAHYRSILRAGAVRMLDAIAAAYPEGIDKERIAVLAEVVSSGGTFSAYLGELVRNGLVEKAGGFLYRATDIYMKGAS